MVSQIILCRPCGSDRLRRDGMALNGKQKYFCNVISDKLMIGEIEVTVIEVRGDQIRLGIMVPWETRVHRKGVWLLLRQ